MEKLLQFTTALSVNQQSNSTDKKDHVANDHKSTIDSEVIDILLGKSDAQEMLDAMAAAEDLSVSVESRKIALDNFELLVEDIDNANNMENLKLWPRILEKLSDKVASIRKLAAWIIGTATQNNPVAQGDAMKAGALSKLLDSIVKECNIENKSKCLYAMSCLLRNNPTAIELLSVRQDLFENWNILQDSLISNPNNSLLGRFCFLVKSLLNEDKEKQKPIIELLKGCKLLKILANAANQEPFVEILCNDFNFLEKFVGLVIELLQIEKIDICILNELRALLSKIQHLNFDLELFAENLFDTIEDIIESFANGQFVLILDDKNRENEGDLICSAQDITTEKMAFMIRYTSGYICVPMDSASLHRLQLPLMVTFEENQDQLRTAYTITCDYMYETTTGISAHDRAKTAQKLADPNSKAEDFVRPGHILPLMARDGGVKIRAGHTEAAIDLCKLAGKNTAAVIAELINDDGSMKRRNECLMFANIHNIRICTVNNLIKALQN